MMQVHRTSFAEIIRIMVAVIAGAVSSLGYIEYIGPNHVGSRMDPSVVRPDPWYGKDGRDQNSRITELERWKIRDEERMRILEEQEIPPDWFKQQVNKLETRIMDLEGKIDELVIYMRNSSN